MRHLEFFSDDTARRYGRKLYRIPFDLHFGCPNRENRYGRGCTFCAGDGARARHLARSGNDLDRQLESGIDYVRRRYGSNGPYIAYFQAFTSTFAPVAKLRGTYSQVLSKADFPLVIISTRPDALPDEVISYLAELNREHEVWVELGVQSSSDATLRRINRGHDFAAVRDAVIRLKAHGIKTAGHVILGLPGEDTETFLQTAHDIAGLHLDALKIHPLILLKKTALAGEYHASPFPLLNEYEYARNLALFLREIPDGTLLMRLSAEFAPEEITGPKWWMSKGEFLQFFREYFEKGDFSGCFARIPTRDGSFTLYHPGFRQNFHSIAGAASEAEYKFSIPSRLAERFAAGEKVKLLDVGFGLGINSLSAVKTALKHPGSQLEITALEYDKRVLAAALSLSTEPLHREILSALDNAGRWQSPDGGTTLNLMLDDARKSVQKLPEKYFDLIWQDGFSPDVNPELWSFDFERRLAFTLAESGWLLSYCSACCYLGALMRCKLQTAFTPSFGRKRGGTIAAVKLPEGMIPLPEKERNIILRSTAGCAYRDAGLDGSRKELLARRRQLLDALHRRGVPKWFKAKQ